MRPVALHASGRTLSPKADRRGYPEYMQSPALHFNREPFGQVDALISRYHTSDLQSPMRSTVPLISLFKHADDLLEILLNELVGGRKESRAHFEYEVAARLGMGEPSHTDVMLFREDHVCAVEAKWTEPPYPSVDAWLAKGKSEFNRRNVLKGWLSLIQRFTDRALEPDAFRNAIYQMVHRAASACESALFPTLAYIQFSPLPDLSSPKTDALFDALSHLHELLGPKSRLSIKLIEVQIKPTSAYEPLRPLNKRDPKSGTVVLSSLRSSALFEFVGHKIHSFMSS